MGLFEPNSIDERRKQEKAHKEKQEKVVVCKGLQMLKATSAAILFREVDGDCVRDVWIPKSQVKQKVVAQGGRGFDVWVPAWLAQAKELIHE